MSKVRSRTNSKRKETQTSGTYTIDFIEMIVRGEGLDFLPFLLYDGFGDSFMINDNNEEFK